MDRRVACASRTGHREWVSTEERLAKLRAGLAELGEDERAKPIAASIKQLEDELKLEKAHYGAAAQLWHAGILEKVLPCENESLLDAAKPIADDGTYREDTEAIEAREDFIVQTLLESGPVSYVILGGSHDLAENVERLSGGCRAGRRNICGWSWKRGGSLPGCKLVRRMGGPAVPVVNCSSAAALACCCTRLPAPVILWFCDISPYSKEISC